MTQPKILIILLMLICGCSNNHSNEYQIMEDKFTWNIQKAGYDFKKYDEMGETNYQNFISEFENFPWLDQLDYHQQIQKGCSPTLSVKDLKSKKNFWVSMSGDRTDNGYLIGYIYPKEEKTFFGFGKSKTINWLEIYLTEDKQLVKKCFDDFFNRQYNKLEKTIRELEEYGQMEAQN